MSTFRHGEAANLVVLILYIYVDDVYLKHSWGCKIQNVSILVAIGVNEDGCCEIIGVVEGMKEQHES